MREVFVFRIKRVVNLERAAGLGEVSGDLHITVEFPGQPVGCAVHARTKEGFDAVAAGFACRTAGSAPCTHAVAAVGDSAETPLCFHADSAAEPLRSEGSHAIAAAVGHLVTAANRNQARSRASHAGALATLGAHPCTSIGSTDREDSNPGLAGVTNKERVAEGCRIGQAERER